MAINRQCWHVERKKNTVSISNVHVLSAQNNGLRAGDRRLGFENETSDPLLGRHHTSHLDASPSPVSMRPLNFERMS